ncbi:hypothetical protein HPP92_020904 [Vanilla planifolia]|uniref:Uncharacterized protein n=1 Tax=Vanilla planifolia TaxID=51239 RepID=A0A835Q008_VANPL|nr:hypothetical protein HPP92_020904 [Vanilla planifolia]
MQRQSLGSPSSKSQIHGIISSEEKENRKSGFPPVGHFAEVNTAEILKAEKPIRQYSRTDRSIHLVPFLILFCFLILFLCSHEPSSEDLAGFEGFSRFFHQKAGEAGRFPAMEKNGMTVLRSHRALKETGRMRSRRLGSP